MPGRASRSCVWDLASPIALLRRDAPPFFVAARHARLARERGRGAALRRPAARVSTQPVVYAELPGAQHAWDVFRSVRAMESVQAVTRFLEWAHATLIRSLACPAAALSQIPE